MSDASTGQERPGYEMVIERGKVREFATSVKSSHPTYLDEEQPVIPPTFLRAAAFWAPRRRPGEGGAQAGGQGSGGGRARGGGGMGRVLHGGQEYVFHGPPPRAGTKLSVTSRQDAQYEKEGRRGGTMTFTETVQEFRDESGRLVAEGRSTNIVTSRPPSEG